MVVAARIGTERGGGIVQIEIPTELVEPTQVTPEKPPVYTVLPFNPNMGKDPERDKRIANIVVAPDIDAEKLRAALSKPNPDFRERRAISRIEELMAKLKAAQAELLAGDRNLRVSDKMMARRGPNY